MSLKAKRLIAVSTVILTAFSLGMSLISIHTFTIAGWLLCSLQIEVGIIVFASVILGAIIGYGWALTGKEHQSFRAYMKFIVAHIVE